MAPSTVEQVVTEQKNTLTTFVTLLLTEEKAQADAKDKEIDAKKDDKDKARPKDPIVNDAQCTP